MGGGWMPQAVGALQSPDPSAPEQGRGAAAQAVYSPPPCPKHGWSPGALPQEGGNGPGARAARPQPAAEVSAQEQGQLQWQINSLLHPEGSNSGRGQVESTALEIPRPSAASLGLVPGPARGRDGQDGWPWAGSGACLVESWQGDCRACCCCARGWVGWVHLLSHGEPWGGSGPGSGLSCSELAATVPFSPLQVMLLEQTGRAAQPFTPGMATSPPALPAFPSCVLQGVGHDVAGAAWL